MTDLVISIGVVEAISIIISVSGALIVIAWHASGKFSRLEAFMDSFDKRLTNIEGRSSGAFDTHSPLSLTDKGREQLEESGLKEYVDENLEVLAQEAAEEQTLETSYDIQETSFDLFDDTDFPPEFERELKEYAYTKGTNIAVLRRIAGIYLRDRLLEKFKSEDSN